MNFKIYIDKLLTTKNIANRTRKIVFMEGPSKRMIEAAVSLEESKLLEPILVFETEESFKSADVKGVKYFIIENEKELMEKLVKIYVKKRKGKETEEQAREVLKKTEYFSPMLVEAGLADGAVGGVHHPTGDILRGAFKSIGPKPDIKTISSIMIMHKGEEFNIFTDISVNVDPTAEQLAEIAKNAADFGDYIDFDKKVAFLSFSTSGSAVNDISKKSKEASEIFNDKYNMKYKSLGEIQFDAAFDLNIRKQKYKDSSFDTKPSVFVFPDLNSGNIGYKIAQRMGNWGAIGPIVTGLKNPINDLSRGSTVDDIINTGILTALQAFG